VPIEIFTFLSKADTAGKREAIEHVNIRMTPCQCEPKNYNLSRVRGRDRYETIDPSALWVEGGR